MYNCTSFFVCLHLRISFPWKFEAEMTNCGRRKERKQLDSRIDKCLTLFDVEITFLRVKWPHQLVM